ncbi:hypothetical protein AAC387_Pa06g2010 [Persea americana]
MCLCAYSSRSGVLRLRGGEKGGGGFGIGVCELSSSRVYGSGTWKAKPREEHYSCCGSSTFEWQGRWDRLDRVLGQPMCNGYKTVSLTSQVAEAEPTKKARLEYLRLGLNSSN